jgi:hypothetical protein
MLWKPRWFSCGMEFWTKNLGIKCKNAMLLQLAQPTLVSMFQLLECMELNMVKKCVVILGFNKDNPRNSSTCYVNNSVVSP